MKFGAMETKPNQVPKQAKLFGEIRDNRSWVEPSVWAVRMLTALERGVKEKVLATKCTLCRARVFSLVTAFATVCQSSER